MEEKKKGGFIKGVLVGIVLTVAVAAAAGGILLRQEMHPQMRKQSRKSG